ncbi:hypothetical protein DSO57_1000702 [Entomophthora muscae]|uniref:Uncharacterized protein n=1 Tax=Entomophthora muscae TaxID=34485 RepID=A0ACC2SM22_9FUNG|nr:hypothetical protein DSO57_1000702 [Entomophthora muscae]
MATRTTSQRPSAESCDREPTPSTAPQSQPRRRRSDPTTIAVKGDDNSGLAIWPILLAVLPPTLSFFFGMDDFWSDTFLLLLVLYYMYSLIQVPWDLYQASRQRRVVNPIDTLAFQTDEGPEAAAVEAARYEAAVQLRRQEMFAFLLVLCSPLIGGWIFILARSRLQALNAFISDFNILLFVLAAEIRPLSHLGELLQGRAGELQDRVHHPTTAVEAVGRRLAFLENELQQLKKVYATKQDVGQVRESLEPNFQKLSQLVLRHQQRDRLESSRFEGLIQDLRHQLSEIKPEPRNTCTQSIVISSGHCSPVAGPMVSTESMYLQPQDENKFPVFSVFAFAQGIPTLALQVVLMPVTLPLSLIGSLAQRLLPSRPTQSLLTQT